MLREGEEARYLWLQEGRYAIDIPRNWSEMIRDQVGDWK